MFFSASFLDAAAGPAASTSITLMYANASRFVIDRFFPIPNIDSLTLATLKKFHENMSTTKSLNDSS